MNDLSFRMGNRLATRYEEVEGPDGIELVETEEWIAYQKRERDKQAMLLANVAEDDKKYIGADAPKNMEKIQAYVRGFLDRKSPQHSRFRSMCLYLWSRRNGTQKSTIARWIGRELIRGGASVHMMLMSDLAQILTKRGFEDEDEFLLERIDEVDLLIIDDAFDAKKITIYKSGYQIPFLDTFFRTRLEGLKRGIIFTSNVPISEIGISFGQSIYALIKRSTPTPMEFNDEINDFNVEDLWS